MSSSIQVVERALDILSLVSKSESEIGVSEIARLTGLHKSTVYRTVFTLNKKEYLYKNKDTSRYSLGKKAFLLGFQATNNLPAARIARPYMAFLSEKYKEIIALDIFKEGHTLTISYYLGNYSSTFYNLDNQRRVENPYRPAVVYCMLAYQSTLEPNDPLLLDYKGIKGVRGPNNILELIEELKEVREKGYSFEDGEFRPGEICYAAPIFDPPAGPGRAVATINISGSKNRLGAVPQEEVIRDIKNAAASITEIWEPIDDVYQNQVENDDEFKKE